MIDELYDSVLSITNEIGYIDRISEKKGKIPTPLVIEQLISIQ